MLDYKDAVHLVLDIETCGINPGCIVTEIGIAIIEQNKVIDKAFWRLNPSEEIFHLGMTVESDTAKWWTEFPIEKRENLVNGSNNEFVSIYQILPIINTFVSKYKIDYFWGNSPDFDFKILDELINRINDFDKTEFKFPWNCFWKLRDVRTLIRGSGLNNSEIKNINQHNALDDAIYEAEQLCNAFKKLGEISND